MFLKAQNVRTGGGSVLLLTAAVSKSGYCWLASSATVFFTFN